MSKLRKLPFILSLALLITGSWALEAAADEDTQQVAPDEEEASRLFEIAEQKSRDFQAVALMLPVRTLRKRIPQKAALYAEAEAAYRDVIDLQSKVYSVEAAFRIAEMTLELRDALRAIPTPPSLVNSPALANYHAWLDEELIYPAHEQALKNLVAAAELALSFDLEVQLQAVERLRTIGVLEEKVVAPFEESSFLEVREAASTLLP